MVLYAEEECQLVLIGGAPLDGPRRMNWNFVASDPELIEQARARWAAGDWPVVPGENGGSNCRVDGAALRFFG
jgi:hypothetical protein